MYNLHLNTFVSVVEHGSFSKASRALFITPSAVIQQINHFEAEMGAVLLIRTPQGVRLSAMGQLVYEEAVVMIKRVNDLRGKLRDMKAKKSTTVRIGTSFLSQLKLFPELWNRFAGGAPDARIEFVPLQGPFQQQSDVDIIETVLFVNKLPPNHVFLPLYEMPLICAVASNHPLSEKKILRYEDLLTTPVVTIRTGLHERLNELYNDLQARGITVFRVDEYTPSVFNACLVNGYILQIPACWDTLCANLAVIPCEWPYTLPYGFLFNAQTNSTQAKAFVEFVRKLQKEGGPRMP